MECLVNFRLLFESEIALFLNQVWGRSAFDGKESPVPDDSMLAFSTELLNYIIAFATPGKARTVKHFDG